MEEEKIPKQKPHTSFNRRLSVVQKPEGNMTTFKKNLKKFILQGETWQRGEYDKGYYGNIIYKYKKDILVDNQKIINCRC